MVKIVQKINQELFMGYDNDCWEDVFTVNDMKIRLFDIYNDPLRNLKSKISIDDFNAIVQSERLKLDSLISDSYRTSEGLNSRPLNTLYYTDLQLIISLFICIFLQVFVPLQYKTCRNIC